MILNMEKTWFLRKSGEWWAGNRFWSFRFPKSNNLLIFNTDCLKNYISFFVSVLEHFIPLTFCSFCFQIPVFSQSFNDNRIVENEL